MSKRRKLDKVQLVKEMSRERIKTPRPQVIPDKRRKFLEGLAKSIAQRFGEEL